jgi:VanZ family protein
MRWRSLLPWLPAIGMMIIIFLASNTPARDIPNFGPLDMVIKKAGHMLGYALLALAYWYGLGFKKHAWWLALVLAILYAMTDEFHQVFIPGRHASWVDVFGFDGGGAALALLVSASFLRGKPVKG